MHVLKCTTRTKNQSIRPLVALPEEIIEEKRTLVVKSVPDPEDTKHHPRNRGSRRVLAIEETGLDASERGGGRTSFGKLAVEVDERGKVAALTGRLSTAIYQGKVVKTIEKKQKSYRQLLV